MQKIYNHCKPGLLLSEMSSESIVVWEEAVSFLLLTAFVFDVTSPIALFMCLTVVHFVGLPHCVFQSVVVYAIVSGILQKRGGQVVWGVLALGYLQRLHELRQLANRDRCYYMCPVTYGNSPAASGHPHHQQQQQQPLQHSDTPVRDGQKRVDLLRAILEAVKFHQSRLVAVRP